MTKKVMLFICLTTIYQSAFAVTLKNAQGYPVADIVCANKKAEAVVAANLEKKDVYEVRIQADQAMIYFSKDINGISEVFPLNNASTCKVTSRF